MKTPLEILLPYQQRWVADPSTRKLGCWARQTGKSLACAAEAVHSCMSTAKTLWVVLSVGERQALEFLLKAPEWAEAFQFTVTEYAEDRSAPQAIATAAQITFANGSRIVGIPANPETARGYAANLILDEFAHHDDADAVWKAIYPSISNLMRGEKKLRITSTPGGSNNKFARLWTDTQGNYSKHKVTIHDAKAAGMAVDIAGLKAGLDDADAWAQEYECEFADSASVLLPYDLIGKCESDVATENVPESFWEPSNTSREKVVLGIDFGRSKDLTVCWTLGLQPNGNLITREVLVLKSMSTPEQEQILRPRVKRAARACLDYTGPGTGLGDYLVRDFGRYDRDSGQTGKVELCTFTAGLKATLFPAIKSQFEANRILVPRSREIREDLHNMQKVVSRTGTLSYSARHTPDGHSDRTTALALANRASQMTASPFQYSSVTFNKSPQLEREIRRHCRNAW